MNPSDSNNSSTLQSNVSILPSLPGAPEDGISSPDSSLLPPVNSCVPSATAAGHDNDPCATPLSSSMICVPTSSTGSSVGSDSFDGRNPMVFGSPPPPFASSSQFAVGIASFSTPNLVQLTEAEMALAAQPMSPPSQSVQNEEPSPSEKTAPAGSSGSNPIPISAVPARFHKAQKSEQMSSSLGAEPAPVTRMHNPSASFSSSELSSPSTPNSARWKAGKRSEFRKTTAILGSSSGCSTPGGFGSPRPSSVYNNNVNSNVQTPRSSLGTESQLAVSSAPNSARLDLNTLMLQRGVEEGKIIMDDNQTDIKFATIDALIERMTTEGLVDPLFRAQFILTYSMHTSADKLLDLLIARYQNPTVPNIPSLDQETRDRILKSVQLYVIVFLQDWLKRLWNSSTPPELTKKLETFLDEISQGPHKNAAEQMKKRISKVGGEEKKVERMFNETPPVPLLPLCLLQGLPQPRVSVRTIHPRELARQMTLVERDLFGALQPWEFQDLRFAKKDKSLAPNVDTITKHFNKVSRWICEEILQVNDLDERIRTVELCIEVAAQCQQLQNYNAVNEVISAFNSSAVHRLHRTWKGLAPRYTQKLAELSALMSNKGSFHALRTQLHNIGGAFIPFLGVYLTDLTFIEEGNPTMRGDLINWKKCTLQARQLTEIETYKKTPYCLKEVPWISEFLKNLDVKETDDDMWNQSITIEPRAPATQPGGSGTAGASSNSSDGASAGDSSSDGKKHVIVLPPGLPQFMAVQANATQTVGDIKKAVLELAVKKHLLDPNSGISLNPDDYSLVAPATRQFPGVLIKELSVMSEMDFEGKGITGFAMFKTQQVIFVDYTLGPEAYFVLAFLDMDSALYSTDVLIDVIFKWQEEFCLMRYCPDNGDLFWLDPNFSLTEQGFGLADHMIVVPKSLMMRPDPEDRTKARMNVLSKMPDCKYGYLTKCDVRQLLRTGIFLPPQGTTRIAPPMSVSSRSLQKSLSASEKGRRFFVVVDSFLFWYNDMQSTTPKDVWNLSYCEISYGTLVTGSLCVVIRMHQMYPFPKLRPKKLLILTANSDSVVRQWFAVLSSRSHYNESTMVFSKSLRELAAREKKSLIPKFIRYACETIQEHAITVPTLFTTPVSMQVIEKMRAEINRGLLPRASDMVDEFAIAQLLLSYFAEMPEPLLTNELYSEFYSYHRSQSAVRVNSTNADDIACKQDACAKLKAITSKLPLEHSVTLYYFIKLLHLWEDVTGEKRVVLPLLQQIMMRPVENQNVSQLSMASDVVETITYQIYSMIDELDFPTDAEAGETYVRPEVSYKASIVPVTVFSPEVRREIIDSVTNEKPLTDLDAQDTRSNSVPIKRAIITRSKGAGGAESSGSGRSASSDGDSSVSGNDKSDAAEENSSASSSHHTSFLSYFHRKKKDITQSARSSSSSSNNSSSSAVTATNSSSNLSSSPAPTLPPPIEPVSPISTSPVPPPADPVAAPSSIPTSLPPQALIPPSSLPGTASQQIELPPFCALPSMPISSSVPFMLQPGALPRMPTSQVDDEIFMNANELSEEFNADVSAPSQFAFDPSLPPMPMSPIGPPPVDDKSQR